MIDFSQKGMYFSKIYDTDANNETIEQIRFLEFCSPAIFFAFTSHIRVHHCIPETKN